jgi:hypothetical protein
MMRQMSPHAKKAKQSKRKAERKPVAKRAKRTAKKPPIEQILAEIVQTAAENVRMGKPGLRTNN